MFAIRSIPAAILAGLLAQAASAAPHDDLSAQLAEMSNADVTAYLLDQVTVSGQVTGDPMLPHSVIGFQALDNGLVYGVDDSGKANCLLMGMSAKSEQRRVSLFADADCDGTPETIGSFDPETESGADVPPEMTAISAADSKDFDAGLRHMAAMLRGMSITLGDAGSSLWQGSDVDQRAIFARDSEILGDLGDRKLLFGDQKLLVLEGFSGLRVARNAESPCSISIEIDKILNEKDRSIKFFIHPMTGDCGETVIDTMFTDTRIYTQEENTHLILGPHFMLGSFDEFSKTFP